MADNRKYYYLKLKEDFFDTDEMKILESMKDGYLYSNILLKLYLKSLSNSGSQSIGWKKNTWICVRVPAGRRADGIWRGGNGRNPEAVASTSSI